MMRSGCWLERARYSRRSFALLSVKGIPSNIRRSESSSMQMNVQRFGIDKATDLQARQTWLITQFGLYLTSRTSHSAEPRSPSTASWKISPSISTGREDMAESLYGSQ